MGRNAVSLSKTKIRRKGKTFSHPEGKLTKPSVYICGDWEINSAYGDRTAHNLLLCEIPQVLKQKL